MNDHSQSDPQPSSNNEEMFLMRVPQPIGYVRLRESLDELEGNSIDITPLLWILALLFFGLGDTVSSFMVFSQGGVELNPVMRWSLTLPGSLLGFVLVKATAISVLYAIAFFWEGAHRWMIPVLLILAGVYLTTNNMMVFLNVR